MQSISSSITSDLLLPSVDLPDGWVAHWNDDLGCYYFHHPQTGRSTSNEPLHHSEGADAMNAAQGFINDVSIPTTQAYISQPSLPAIDLSNPSQSSQSAISSPELVSPPNMPTGAEPKSAPAHGSLREDSNDTGEEPASTIELSMERNRKRPTPKDPAKFKHECHTCGKRFTRSTTLREHKRTHNGERPFPCSVCATQFARSKDRSRHEALHRGEKKFYCDLSSESITGACGRGFAREDGLIAHLRTDRGWECLQMLMDAYWIPTHADDQAIDGSGYRCKLSPRACRTKFNCVQDLNQHLCGPDNRNCMAEWLIRQFLDIIRMQRAEEQETSSSGLNSEEQHPSTSREPSLSPQLATSTQFAPSLGDSRSREDRIQEPSIVVGNPANPVSPSDVPLEEGRSENGRATSEPRPSLGCPLAQEADLDINPFAGCSLVASGFTSSYSVDQVWVNLKCPHDLCAFYHVRIGTYPEGDLTVILTGAASSGYSCRLKTSIPFTVSCQAEAKSNEHLLVCLVYGPRHLPTKTFPIGTLRYVKTSNEWKPVLDPLPAV